MVFLLQLDMIKPVLLFQQSDRPGSLLAILQEFAARSINLTKLESRPTREGLGRYCFLLDLEGHIADSVMADCLKTLQTKDVRVKFLGSYPAAGDHAETVREESNALDKAEELVRHYSFQTFLNQVTPPSTTIFCPVTQLPAFDTRYKTAAAISVGVPTPNGIRCPKF